MALIGWRCQFGFFDDDDSKFKWCHGVCGLLLSSCQSELRNTRRYIYYFLYTYIYNRDIHIYEHYIVFIYMLYLIVPWTNKFYIIYIFYLLLGELTADLPFKLVHPSPGKSMRMTIVSLFPSLEYNYSRERRVLSSNLLLATATPNDFSLPQLFQRMSQKLRI